MSKELEQAIDDAIKELDLIDRKMETLRRYLILIKSLAEKRGRKRKATPGG